MSRDSDNQIVLRLLAGVADRQPEAFQELYLMVNRRIYRFAKQRLKSPEMAEEVLNDTVLELWRNPLGFNGDSWFTAYVLGIAHRKMIDRLPRSFPHGTMDQAERGELPAQESSEFDLSISAQDLSISAEDGDAVMRCLDRVPDFYLAPLYLAYSQGLSREEIAQVLGCSASLVGSRIFRGLRLLRECLAQSQ